MIKEAVKYLPERIERAVMKASEGLMDNINEIRLRRDLPLSLSVGMNNVFIDMSGRITKLSDGIVTGKGDIEYCINRLCEGSVYRYMHTINSGYIITGFGIRAGVCGECVYENGRISAVREFSSINIRIPKNIEELASDTARFIQKNPFKSILIFSPPGEGKTTYIRSLACLLSKGQKPKRIAVIDERGEIFPSAGGFINSAGIIDRLGGYSKHEGIEIATRLFSPEIIICDEIGQSDDINAMMSAQNNGIALIATTHGDTVSSLLSRPIIKRLIEHRVFDYLLRLKRENASMITQLYHTEEILA